MAIIKGIQGDLKIGSGSTRFIDACADSSNLYTIADDKNFRSYSFTGLAQTAIGTISLGANTPAGISLISSASAVVCFTAAEIDFINLSTGQRTNVTTGATSARTNSNPQQIAGNQTNNIAIATSSVLGQVQKIIGTTQTISALSPSGISGATAQCVINKLDTNTWLVGSGAPAKVVEIDSTGATIKSVTIPTTPKDTSSPSHNVYALSYYNGIVVAAVDMGNIYFYNWSSGTLIHTMPGVKSTTIGNNSFLSEGTNGFFFHLPGHTFGSGSLSAIQAINIGLNGHGNHLETLWNEAQGQARFCNYNASANKLWIGFNSFTGVQLRVFNLNPTTTVSENTRSQDPVGSNVSARIIRYRDQGPGRGFVELDQNVIAGTVALNCVDSQNYIEIALHGSGPEKWDIREFSS